MTPHSFSSLVANLDLRFSRLEQEVHEAFESLPENLDLLQMETGISFSEVEDMETDPKFKELVESKFEPYFFHPNVGSTPVCGYIIGIYDGQLSTCDFLEDGQTVEQLYSFREVDSLSQKIRILDEINDIYLKYKAIQE